MALHRDIYWIGRQWSVTGYGLQLIDQRLKGVFDIEIALLWDDGALDAMRAHDWLKAEDFEKAIAAARKRFPEPARPRLDQLSKPPLPVEMLLALNEPVAPALPPSPVPATFSRPAPGRRPEGGAAGAGLQNRPAWPVGAMLQLSEPVSPAPAPAKKPPPALSLGAESARAELLSPLAFPADMLLRPSEPVSPAPHNLPAPATRLPPAPGLRTESGFARAELRSAPPSLAETLERASEPAASTPSKSAPSALDFRTESERATADLQSKMSALDGLLRSRGFVAPQPVMPQPSLLAVQAEGELAKFAPQWRVRN